MMVKPLHIPYEIVYSYFSTGGIVCIACVTVCAKIWVSYFKTFFIQMLDIHMDSSEFT